MAKGASEGCSVGVEGTEWPRPQGSSPCHEQEQQLFPAPLNAQAGWSSCAPWWPYWGERRRLTEESEDEV